MDAAELHGLLVLASDARALGGAKQIAGTIVNHDPTNMHNCCAATLSCLLDFAGIYVGVREEVTDLAPHLENDRGWGRIAVGSPIVNGDVGVFISNDASGLHHIYLVIDANSQATPIVADNQGVGAHPRPVAGGLMPGVGNSASPTSYFLRAT
jgi:hypothetical protein